MVFHGRAFYMEHSSRGGITKTKGAYAELSLSLYPRLLKRSKVRRDIVLID